MPPRLTEWAVTNVGSIDVLEPYAVVVPYSTWLVIASVLVHVIVALDAVRFLTVIALTRSAGVEKLSVAVPRLPVASRLRIWQKYVVAGASPANPWLWLVTTA